MENVIVPPGPSYYISYLPLCLLPAGHLQDLNVEEHFSEFSGHFSGWLAGFAVCVHFILSILVEC